MNRRYVKWSLLTPLIYSVLLFINYKIGSTEGEFQMRPYGFFSDLISFIIFITIIILGVCNFKYFNCSIKNAINTLMIIFNTIYFILSFAMLGSALLSGILIVLLTMTGLIIPYIIVYIIQFFRYISIINNGTDE